MTKQAKKIWRNARTRVILLTVIFGVCLLCADTVLNMAFTLPLEVAGELPGETTLEPIEIPHGPTAVVAVPEPAVPQRSHAPEPSSIFMVMSGVGAALMRFARKSFLKFKRLFDIVTASIGLVLSLPIVGIAALLVKLTSKGPVLYRQLRAGKDGEPFYIYKLRSMVVNAEKATGAVWARENDPRITPIGRFLRKTHVDEIPQLINVLKGQMSIIGPRPERPEFVQQLKKQIPEYEKRLAIRPGITGLAQVWHKYDETLQDVKKKIKYDVLYIRKMCFLVDVRILLRTVVVVLTGSGAR